ncbi:hypothetical protein ACMF93_000021 [Campylobacter jejuni]|uniref:hypothetical protein n=1 Tax=Campylobacter jejuni TaxID=197 RepID=UPI00069C7B8A|nr:hypothetical protein [Campylobacter jejuni]EAK6248416.1 hypothetical protein [Campylobacter jejuni]ECP7643553.1 hypothetical protein [Campylobacter jejuni]ECR2944509.1 hypothetical protein [Campylobacter jejuni]OEW90722.1 hypothetical protein A0M36_08830 [Campylobacter jejuni]RTJ13404.1 hypothetical protein C3H92_00595 [Campylobacter jejuni]
MIYILEFFKGASLALMFLCTFFLFFKFISYFYLVLGFIFSLLLFLVFMLFIENYELKNQKK